MVNLSTNISLNMIIMPHRNPQSHENELVIFWVDGVELIWPMLFPSPAALSGPIKEAAATGGAEKPVLHHFYHRVTRAATQIQLLAASSSAFHTALPIL